MVDGVAVPLRPPLPKEGLYMLVSFVTLTGEVMVGRYPVPVPVMWWVLFDGIPVGDQLYEPLRPPKPRLGL